MSGSDYSGGCQCGAVRYSVRGSLTEPSICHCRMCQKAFGSFFAPLVSVALVDFALMRGELAIFRSSDLVERGFCGNCGTPLTFHETGTGKIGIAIGSLDRPELARPVEQVGAESRLPWFGELAGLPDESTDGSEGAVRARQIAETNHQHPDHDTQSWTPFSSNPGHSH